MDARLKDKEWRMSHLYKIKNKQKKVIQFVKNKSQKHFDNNKHTRNIILKSRQLGFSTFEAIDMFDDVLFTKNFEGLFIAQDLETAKDVFDNKIKFAWTNYNLQHLYASDLDSARKLKLDFRNKTFSSITVDSSGRSGTFNRLHITEFAKLCKNFPDKAREVLDGSIPAVPMDGRVDMESTAFGSDGLFYDLFWHAWDRGVPEHKTQFKAHFYNWQWDEEIDTVDKISNLPLEFIAYQKLHNLTDLEISYYYLKYLSLGETERNWQTMKREYPTTPEEAFEGSGNKIFDLVKLGLQKLMKPIQEYSGFKIYKTYSLGHRYGIGVDCAEGIGRDSSTIVVWDFTPSKPEIVAEHNDDKISPDMLAHEVKNIAEKYEYPIVAIERNNHGHTTISKLREIYPDRHIFKDTDGRHGWKTTLVSKPKMLFELSTAVNEELVNINSANIISEMRRYDQDELRFIRSTEDTTKHYDLLMATTIGFQMKNQAQIRVKKQVEDRPKVVRGTGMRAT